MDSKALGKGLSALIPRKIEDDRNSSEALISSLEIAKIKNNRFQPRKAYDEEKLSDLKASIKEKGILQPILVRPVGDGYEVVAGERRLRAARALGLGQVPVIVKNVTDREALVLALVENIQREELNAIEEAQGFKRLIEEFNFTQESVAESVGKDRTTIANLLRLLRLPAEIQAYVAGGKLSVGHARALLSLENAAAQKKMADAVIAKSMSVRQIEALVRKTLEDPAAAKTVKSSKPKDRDIQILQEELSRLLGTKVTIEDRNNKGKLTVEYYSLDDFDRILAVLRK